MANRNSGKQKPGISQPVEIRGDQITPLLAFAALLCEISGYGAYVSLNGRSLHRNFLPAGESSQNQLFVVPSTSSTLCADCAVMRHGDEQCSVGFTLCNGTLPFSDLVVLQHCERLLLEHWETGVIGGDGGKLREQFQLGESGRSKPIVKCSIGTPGRNNPGAEYPGRFHLRLCAQRKVDRLVHVDRPNNNTDAAARSGHPGHFAEHPLCVTFLLDRARECNIDAVVGEWQGFGPPFAQPIISPRPSRRAS